MAPPPLFSGLDQAVRDVLYNGYIFDLFKLYLTTDRCVGIRVGGFQHFGMFNVVVADLEARSVIKRPNYTVSLVEMWDTGDVITAEVIVDKPGVKVSTVGTFDCKTLMKELRATCEYRNDFAAVNVNTEFKSLKPVINTSAVLAYNEWWLGGINVRYDTKDNVLNSTELAVSYTDEHISIITSLYNNAFYQAFECSIFQKLSDTMDFGMQIRAMHTSGKYYSSLIAFGTKYQVKEDIILRTKFNNKHQLCLGFGIKLMDGVILTLCSLIKCRKFSQGRHKFGIGLEFKPSKVNNF